MVPLWLCEFDEEAEERVVMSHLHTEEQEKGIRLERV
jgi:hypothetical protein